MFLNLKWIKHWGKKTCIHFSSWVGGKKWNVDIPRVWMPFKVYVCQCLHAILPCKCQRTSIPHLTPGSTCMCASVCVPFFLCKCHGAWTSSSPYPTAVFACHSWFASAKERQRPTLPHHTPGSTCQCMCARVCVQFLPYTCQGSWTSHAARPHPAYPTPGMCASVCVPFLVCKRHGTLTSHPSPPQPTPPTSSLVWIGKSFGSQVSDFSNRKWHMWDVSDADSRVTSLQPRHPHTDYEKHI